MDFLTFQFFSISDIVIWLSLTSRVPDGSKPFDSPIVGEAGAGACVNTLQ